MENEVFETIQAARAGKRQHLFKSLGGVMPETFQKAEEVDENPFQKAAQEAEMEKSDVMNAIQYGGDIKVSKTGKEIKKQVTDILIPELNAQLETKKTEANECLKSCGQAPTKDISPWWTDELRVAVSYKVYDWQEMRVPRADEQTKMSATLSVDHAEEVKKKFNIPKTEDEALSRELYNECVRSICNITVDLEACRICQSLKDATEYELTPKQFATFRF